MNCNEWREQLALLAYDELPADEADAVRAHVASCKRCADELQSLHTAQQSLEQWPSVHSARSAGEVLDAIAEPQPVVATVGVERRSRRWVPWTAGIAAGLLAALTVFAAGVEISRTEGRLTLSFGRAAADVPVQTQPAALSHAQLEELKAMLIEHADSNTAFGLDLVDERFNELEHAQDRRFLALVHTIRTMREEDMQRFEDALTAVAMDSAQQTQETRAALQSVVQQMAMRP